MRNEGISSSYFCLRLGCNRRFTTFPEKGAEKIAAFLKLRQMILVVRIVYGSTCYISFSFAERNLLNSLTAALLPLTYIGNKNHVGQIERLDLWNMEKAHASFIVNKM